MNSNEENKKIKVILMLEIIGRPPEHLTETLEKLIEQMGKEKGVQVKEKKIREPNLMKEQEGFYISFAEIEVEVEEISNLVVLLFKYMPAHIEIISPEKITLTNNGWNEILNELTRRLHGYDEVARVIQMEKTILEKKLKELMPDKEEEK